MDKQTLPRLFIGAASLLVGLSIAMLVATQIYSAHDVDIGARARAELVVENGLDDYARELGRKALPQTYWDDAVVHLDNHFDPAWAHEYIGSYLWETEGFERVMVFDSADRPRYAMDKGRALDPASLAQMTRAARPVIADIRQREHDRGPLPAHVAKSERLNPILTRSVALIGGDVVLLSATLVQPDESAHPLASRSAVVVVGKTLDSLVVAALSERYLLPDAALRPADYHPGPSRAVARFRDDYGRLVAQLDWKAPAPGAALLDKSWPLMLLFALILSALVAWLLGKGNAVTRRLVASEKRASHLAFHDALTGLPNRALLNDAYATMQARAARTKRGFAMHCIDLDLFKAVNDSFGHLAGDELIRAVARTLQEVCGPDDFLARFGGDEFVVLQAHATAEAASQLAERMIAGIGGPIDLVVGRVFIGASIGILVVDDAALDAQECLRRADLALYAAKAGGRNSFSHFDTAMDVAVRDRHHMRAMLHEALANDELTLSYQPQVDKHGEIIGVEALARWNHDELGHVSPSAFVAVAEESGLIEALGLFTLRQAFTDSRRWPGLRIAINVSAVQLRSKDFVARLEDLVADYAVDPVGFELEITERVLLGDDSQTLATLQALRAMGFRIALDDFGTGYSSLGYLQRYPVDKVKIDRSFVARIGLEPQAEVVIIAIVRLARALGLDVIAEGVETDAQRLCLTVAGCPNVQGFLTGRPMAPEGIDRLMMDNGVHQATGG